MRLCKFPGCGEKHKARGFCGGHYEMWLKRRPMTPIKREEPAEPIKPAPTSAWTGQLKDLMENAPR